MTIDEKLECLSTRTGVARLGVKSFGSSEGIHGVVNRAGNGPGTTAITTTQFPQPPGMGETWDPALVRQAAAVEGYEARFVSQSEKYGRAKLMLWVRKPTWCAIRVGAAAKRYVAKIR